MAALLTGSSPAAREKAKIKEMLRSGLISPVAIGTHALIEKDVEFANLGLVIIDEQHRFGVMQRFSLVRRRDPGCAGDDRDPDPAYARDDFVRRSGCFRSSTNCLPDGRRS